MINLELSRKERLRRSIKKFIDRRVASHGLAFHIGKITSYTPNEDVVIRLLDVEGVIEISWKENLLIILKEQSFIVGDNVLLVYSNVHGKFIVINSLVNGSSFIPDTPREHQLGVLSFIHPGNNITITPRSDDGIEISST